MKKSCWYVYMILTEKNRLYTGIATDVERRFFEHACDPSKGAKFFRSDSPKEIVYVESCGSRSRASVKEAEIKKLNRKEKNIFLDGVKT